MAEAYSVQRTAYRGNHSSLWIKRGGTLVSESLILSLVYNFFFKRGIRECVGKVRNGSYPVAPGSAGCLVPLTSGGNL